MERVEDDLTEVTPLALNAKREFELIKALVEETPRKKMIALMMSFIMLID